MVLCIAHSGHGITGYPGVLNKYASDTGLHSYKRTIILTETWTVKDSNET